MREVVDAGEARPEEIVVLVRSTGDLPVYERALEDAGLQTMASGGRGYWGRQVVRDLCAWLAALANPSDEQALFGVLASPLVGVSTDALALIAQAGTGRAWRTIEEGAVLERLEADDRERLAPGADVVLLATPEDECLRRARRDRRPRDTMEAIESWWRTYRADQDSASPPR